MIRRTQWDIFCKVIDNFGDIGVCWRLAAELARRGQLVRLWVDDASALRFMAPLGTSGVHVLPWQTAFDVTQADLKNEPCEILIEAFGCEVAPEFIAACAHNHWAGGPKPVWIDLEYLSAEAYAERSHKLASPVQFGPAAGWQKWFFYPGFTPRTGGLLHERHLAAQQAAFNRSDWLMRNGIDWQDEQLVSLFCYEPQALAALLEQLTAHGLCGERVRLLVTAGRAETAVRAVFEHQNTLQPNINGRGLLSISYLPLLTQAAFDELLWACDLNFVRGEDSLVRAIWAGKPLIWQAYPQADAAHHAKLDALLEMIEAPASMSRSHAIWNDCRVIDAPADSAILPPNIDDWSTCVTQARARLLEQDDLCTQLLDFATLKRGEDGMTKHAERPFGAIAAG
jgi:uncharacterized repeat protein (TIGR03837 family)